MGAPSKQAFAIAGLLAAVLGVAGCGETVSTSSFSGEGHAVAERISSFQRHATEASEGNICKDDVSAHLKQTLKAAHSSCAEALKEQLKQVEDVSLSVKSISVHGTSAAARVQSTWSGKTCVSTLLLEREGKAWKIAGSQAGICAG
ncbi:MAG: hypothetical protein KGJ43_00210 [Acidobacteriota bacterium]|nr:hypothetical protein [Acidobacteriota bacterium]